MAKETITSIKSIFKKIYITSIQMSSLPFLTYLWELAEKKIVPPHLTWTYSTTGVWYLTMFQFISCQLVTMIKNNRVLSGWHDLWCNYGSLAECLGHKTGNLRRLLVLSKCHPVTGSTEQLTHSNTCKQTVVQIR